jgi:hypothetical protein
MKEAWDGKINERNDNLPELEQRNSGFPRLILGVIRASVDERGLGW